MKSLEAAKEALTHHRISDYVMTIGRAQDAKEISLLGLLIFLCHPDVK